MKKQLKRILAAALILALSLLALTSCNTQPAEGECLVIIGAGENHKEYKINLEEVEITEGVLSLVKYLEEKEGLEAEYTDSGYGAYFTSIDTLIPEITAEKYEYIAIFTTVEEDFDTSTSFKEIEYKGQTFGYSGLGVSSMTVAGGESYYITIEAFVYE